MSLAPLTWGETRARMRADHARLLTLLAWSGPQPPRSAYLHPSYVCVFLYRLSNHWFRAGHGWLARIAWHVNVLLTGGDINYLADLGPGLVLLHPAGVSLMGTAGRNLTVMAGCGLGGEINRQDDVAGWPGVPLLGDDVVLEPHSGVLGPVRVGDRVRISSCVVVTRNVDDDMVVTGPAPKLLRRANAGAAAAHEPPC